MSGKRKFVETDEKHGRYPKYDSAGIQKARV
jgi:hypothetical protein